MGIYLRRTDEDRLHLEMSSNSASCCSSEALRTLRLSTFTILLMCTFITCREMMLRREERGKTENGCG